MKKSELKECQRLSEVAAIVYDEESKIDLDDKVYLMTLTPYVKYLPDCDFNNQHLFMAQYVQSYLQTCKSGLACVESTQSGVPHYHLWYQTYDDYRDMARVKWVKVLQRVFDTKINTKLRHYKINKWYKKNNGLFYYKEDAVGQQLFTPYNPISATSPLPKVDYTDYNMFFTIQKKHTSRQIIEKTSQIADLRAFYEKSI